MSPGKTVKNAALLITAIFSVLIISGYFVIKNPLAFQKSLVIQATELNRLSYVQKKGIDIKELIEAIPYKDGKTIYVVEPELKFKKTIIDGYGNCSNLSFGLGYYLSKHNHKYQIIAFLHHNDFMNGVGHVAMHTTYNFEGEVHSGIVDMLEGGLPKNDKGFLDLNDLIQGNLNNVSILALNDKKDTTSPYYGKFSNNSAIGVTTSEDVKEYFDFIQSIYIPLGNIKLDKYIYDGISLLMGKYPAIYVSKSDYNLLFKDHKSEKYLSLLLLYSLRLLILIGLLLSILLLYKKIKYKASVKTPVDK